MNLINLFKKKEQQESKDKDIAEDQEKCIHQQRQVLLKKSKMGI